MCPDSVPLEVLLERNVSRLCVLWRSLSVQSGGVDSTEKRATSKTSDSSGVGTSLTQNKSTLKGSSRIRVCRVEGVKNNIFLFLGVSHDEFLLRSITRREASCTIAFRPEVGSPNVFEREYAVIHTDILVIFAKTR